METAPRAQSEPAQLSFSFSFFCFCPAYTEKITLKKNSYLSKYLTRREKGKAIRTKKRGKLPPLPLPLRWPCRTVLSVSVPHQNDAHVGVRVTGPRERRPLPLLTPETKEVPPSHAVDTTHKTRRAHQKDKNNHTTTGLRSCWGEPPAWVVRSLTGMDGGQAPCPVYPKKPTPPCPAVWV